MNVSSRCDYACRAVVELARHAGNESPLTTTLIAERRRIPEKYLPHILLQLKRAGIVKSVRGAQGGYLLARAPEQISLLDVVRAIDGPILTPPPGADANSDDLARAWRDIAENFSEILRKVSIQAVLDSTTRSNMYFI
jgi:Rrf2 family transcriptional regulator, cysteine metabolism repressor